MDYNFQASLEHILTDSKEKIDDHRITVSANIGSEQFLAITENSLAEGAKTRNVKVQIMTISDALIKAGDKGVDSSMFVRGKDEKHVTVTLQDVAGKQVGLAECDYGL